MRLKGRLSLLSFLLFAAGTILSVLPAVAQPLPGGTLDPTTIPKYVEALKVPSVMPLTGTIQNKVDYYEVAARQFRQQVLPTGMPKTTVWGYGSVSNPATYPGPTFEAKVDRPVRVKWINDLKNPRPASSRLICCR